MFRTILTTLGLLLESEVFGTDTGNVGKLDLTLHHIMIIIHGLSFLAVQDSSIGDLVTHSLTD